MSNIYLLGKTLKDITISYFIKKQNKNANIRLIGGNGIIDVNKYFTIEEVKKHTTTKDAWIILTKDNVKCVFNVTHWIPEHPGGAEILIENLGIDATNNFEAIGHSDVVYNILLPKYFIGFLKN